jgi:hypothetical protein
MLHLSHPLDVIFLIIYGKNINCEVSHYAVFSSLLSVLTGPNILLSILFLNTLNLFSSYNVGDQLSQLYKL